MKLKYCALCLLTLLAVRGWTQKPAGAPKPEMRAPMPITDSIGQAVIKAKCQTRHIELPFRRRNPDNPTLFLGIRVLDYRRDPSRVGVVHSGLNSQAQILMRDGTAGEVFESFLDSVYASPKGDDSLLVVIKDLWISDSIDLTVVRHGIFYNPDWWHLAFRFEAYLQRDGGFVPLTYLDTLAEIKGSEDPDIAEHRLLGLTNLFMQKVWAMDNPGIVGRKRRVTMAQIDSFAQHRFDYPMDTVVWPVKGAYASIEEFRNNRPSITDYKINKGNQGILDLSVRDPDGHYYYSHTLWGFCDGTQTYVMMDGNLFPMFRVHHQIYVLGSDQYRRDVVAIIPFMLPLGPGAMLFGAATVNSGIYRKLQLFRLDADTGAVVK